MTTILAYAGQALTYLLWVVLWLVGGWWLTRRAFSLSDNENWLIGIAIGLTAQVWLANLLSQVISVPHSFWLSAAIVFLAGFCSWFPFRGNWKDMFKVKASVGLIFILLFSIYGFYMIGRGLAIADDFQNLPLTSLLAAGDIPIHFPLNPSLRFGYHYFLLLFAGQTSRIAGLAPWIALDFARAIAFGLSLLLAGFFGYRLTRNKWVGFFTAIFFAFSMGTRWLLLFLPPALIGKISESIQLMGSGLSSAPDLAKALISPWAISGNGPIAFPFAFANGVNSPGVMMHNGIGGSQIFIMLTLLLTYKRWRNWISIALTTVLLASLGLVEEIGVVLSIVAWGVILIGCLLFSKNHRVPKKVWIWLVISLVAFVIIAFQGGVISAMIGNLFHPSLSANSYYLEFKYHFVFPPVLVSSHLGVLDLGNPAQLIVALLEFGPILFALPFLVGYLIRSFKAQRWFEANLLLASLLSLGGLFFIVGGTVGESGTTRFFVEILNAFRIFTIPLLYFWLHKKGWFTKLFSLVLIGCTMVGGIVLFGIETIAVQKPINSEFINELDGIFYENFWNNLEPGAQIFDPIPNRTPTIFGRLTNSSLSWFDTTADWQKLYDNPDPYTINSAGFAYVYLDRQYWDELSPSAHLSLKDSCIKLLFEVVRPDPRDLTRDDFRRLLDIRGCHQ